MLKYKVYLTKGFPCDHWTGEVYSTRDGHAVSTKGFKSAAEADWWAYHERIRILHEERLAFNGKTLDEMIDML